MLLCPTGTCVYCIYAYFIYTDVHIYLNWIAFKECSLHADLPFPTLALPRPTHPLRTSEDPWLQTLALRMLGHLSGSGQRPSVLIQAVSDQTLGQCGMERRGQMGKGVGEHSGDGVKKTRPCFSSPGSWFCLELVSDSPVSGLRCTLDAETRGAFLGEDTHTLWRNASQLLKTQSCDVSKSPVI